MHKFSKVDETAFRADVNKMTYEKLGIKYGLTNLECKLLIEKLGIVRYKLVFIHSGIDPYEFFKEMKTLSKKEIMKKYSIRSHLYYKLRNATQEFIKNPIVKPVIIPERIVSLVEQSKKYNSVVELAKVHGISRQRVSQLLLLGGRSIGKEKAEVYKKKIEDVKRLFLEGNDGATICKILEISEWTLKRICEQNNLKIRFHHKKWNENFIKEFMIDYRNKMKHRELATKYDIGFRTVNTQIIKLKKLGY